MTFIISSKNAAALKRSLEPDKKNTWVEFLPKVPARSEFKTEGTYYLDISGMRPAELKKAVRSLKKNRAGSLWGIIDPKGTAEDPASFFFEGACDYIGKALVARGLTKKRFTAALSRFLAAKTSPLLTGKVNVPAGKFKLPSGKFKGWKSIRAGTTAYFFFLFVSLAGKSNLRSQVGETGVNAVKNRLRDVLLQGLHEADALFWMETGDNNVFLVPSRAANGRAAVAASLKMILNSRIIGLEKLGLSFPVDFTFALHYGKTVFHAPGKTGAVVSESVNYIFHLGTKKAEKGRLTVSGDVPEEALPEGLLELFIPAGVFEGIPIRHSRRFVYK